MFGISKEKNRIRRCDVVRYKDMNSHYKLCFLFHLSILSDFLATFRSLTFDRSRCLTYRKSKFETEWWRLHQRRSSLEVETSRACGVVRGMQPLLLLSCCGALTPPSFSELLWAGAAARPLGSSPAAGPLCRRGNLQ
jgi:hypothetical protein